MDGAVRCRDCPICLLQWPLWLRCIPLTRPKCVNPAPRARGVSSHAESSCDSCLASHWSVWNFELFNGALPLMNGWFYGSLLLMLLEERGELEDGALWGRPLALFLCTCSWVDLSHERPLQWVPFTTNVIVLWMVHSQKLSTWVALGSLLGVNKPFHFHLRVSQQLTSSYMMGVCKCSV